MKRDESGRFLSGPLQDEIERFWTYVAEPNENGCREWQGYRTRFGHGRFKRNVGRQNVAAHRFAWMIEHGPIPVDLVIRHDCDNPPCCEVSHLRAGTHQDNQDDMKQRHRRRESMQRLTDDEVREIRRLAAEGSMSHTAIARQFGITQPYVGMLLRGVNRRGTLPE